MIHTSAKNFLRKITLYLNFSSFTSIQPLACVSICLFLLSNAIHAQGKVKQTNHAPLFDSEKTTDTLKIGENLFIKPNGVVIKKTAMDSIYVDMGLMDFWDGEKVNSVYMRSINRGNDALVKIDTNGIIISTVEKDGDGKLVGIVSKNGDLAFMCSNGGGIYFPFLADSSKQILKIDKTGRLYADKGVTNDVNIVKNTPIQFDENGYYTFNGTSQNDILPMLSKTVGKRYTLMNMGSGEWRISTPDKASHIFINNNTNNEVLLKPGECIHLYNNGIVWYCWK